MCPIPPDKSLPVPPPAIQKRRGAPKGNLNALKHGRRSARVRETRAIVRILQTSGTLQETADAPVCIPVEYAAAIRWSRDELACLHMAVIKQAEVVRWRIDVVHALQTGRDLPAPPAILPTQREMGLYSIYVEQRRLLIDSLDRAGNLGLEEPEDSFALNIGDALKDLTEWQLASAALPADLLAETGIDAAAEYEALAALWQDALEASPAVTRFLTDPFDRFQRQFEAGIGPSNKPTNVQTLLESVAPTPPT